MEIIIILISGISGKKMGGKEKIRIRNKKKMGGNRKKKEKTTLFSLLLGHHHLRVPMSS